MGTFVVLEWRVWRLLLGKGSLVYQIRCSECWVKNIAAVGLY